MDILVKKATIIAPDSEYHLQKMDILIAKGKISRIEKNIKASPKKIIESKNLHCSIGWLDIGTHMGEPGYEHRETIQSISEAAKKGGYTCIAPFPNTHPVIQSKAEIQYIKNKAAAHGITFYPIGALSKDCEGKEMSEMVDMSRSGSIAFSDGLKPIQNGGLLLRALEYVKGFNGIIIHHPNDGRLHTGGQIHEGEASTKLGLKGIPSIAEDIMVSRDINLTEYASSSLVLHSISTIQSRKAVKEAKKKGLKIFATTSYLNLIMTDDALTGFDSNLKVSPPLRSEADRKALIKGLKEGTIDAIVSNHVPLEEEQKKLEFPYAEFGAIGIETTYAALNTHIGKTIDNVLLVKSLAYRPRKILNLPVPEIAIGAKANLTLFDPDIEWEVKKTDIKSLSYNNPFISKRLKGKVISVVC